MIQDAADPAVNERPAKMLKPTRSSLPPPFTVVVVGPASTGKSTLVAHLLASLVYNSSAILTRVAEVADREQHLDKRWAWLVDTAPSFRQRNATLAPTFSAGKHTKSTLTFIDTPSMPRHLKHALMTLPQADLAVLVLAVNVDIASEFAIGSASRELAALSFGLGHRHLVVVVNKIDMVETAS